MRVSYAVFCLAFGLAAFFGSGLTFGMNHRWLRAEPV